MSGRAPLAGGLPDSPGSEIAPSRVAGRARFAKLLHAYLEAAHLRGQTLAPAWAARLGVTPKTMYEWSNVLRTRGTIAAGDLEALEPIDLLDLLDAWARDVRARVMPATPSRDVMHIALETGARAGQVSGAVLALAASRDGCDEAGLRAIARELHQLELDASHSRLAIDAEIARRVQARSGR